MINGYFVKDNGRHIDLDADLHHYLWVVDTVSSSGGYAISFCAITYNSCHFTTNHCFIHAQEVISFIY